MSRYKALEFITEHLMTTETGDTSDEEYLYGREGQAISTPPPAPAEDSVPLSAEMAELEVNEESFGNKTEENQSVDPERSASDQEAVPINSNESFKSPEPSIKVETASLSPDTRVSVVQQSPAAPNTNEASGNESSEDDEDANDSSDDGIRITIGDGNIISTSAAIPQQTPFARSFGDGGQASKQLDITTVGNVNGVSLYDLDMETSFDEKPWRKPGADITDYFNYGFTEDSWKTYCVKQKQLRQDFKPQPILEDSLANNEIVVIGDKPMPLPIKKELGMLPPEFDAFAPPVFHPLFSMPPPVMPHLGGMLPPVVGVPQLDHMGLGPPPLHLPHSVLPPFQPDPSRDPMMHPPFPPHGFRDPPLFPEHLYPDFLHDFVSMEQRDFKSMSPRKRTSLESLSDYSFSSEESQGRHQRQGREYRDSKRGERRRHSPRERHRPHRDGRERERERDRGRDKERDREREREREREKDHRMHERSRHRDKELEAEKHLHQERPRDREPRERVVRRLGVRGGEGAGAGAGPREQRGRHERKKHREPGNQEGSPRKRAKRTRHGTDAKSPSLL